MFQFVLSLNMPQYPIQVFQFQSLCHIFWEIGCKSQLLLHLRTSKPESYDWVDLQLTAKSNDVNAGRKETRPDTTLDKVPLCGSSLVSCGHWDWYSHISLPKWRLINGAVMLILLGNISLCGIWFSFAHITQSSLNHHVGEDRTPTQWSKGTVGVTNFCRTSFYF